MRPIGRRHSAAERLRAQSAQANYQNPLGFEKAARELLDKKLSNAAKEVRDFKFSSGLITLGNDERLEDKIINVGVSIDGSWSSRG